MKKTTERDHCKAVAELLWKWEGLGKITFCHVANEGKRHFKTGAILKSMGLRAGFPDYWIGIRGGQTLFIEMKREGNYLTDKQHAYHQILKDRGFDVETVTAKSPQDAVAQVNKHIMARIK